MYVYITQYPLPPQAVEVYILFRVGIDWSNEICCFICRVFFFPSHVDIVYTYNYCNALGIAILDIFWYFPRATDSKVSIL